MIGQIREFIKSTTGSSGWRSVRKLHIQAYPECAACFRKASQVHHIRPFHLHPELELEPTNLISFCDDHHLLFGHLMSWRSFNVDVVSDAANMKQKIIERPAVVNTASTSFVQSILNWIFK